LEFVCFQLNDKQRTEQCGTVAQKELHALPEDGTDQHNMPSATDFTLQYQN